MKVVINDCYGGFGLSAKAVKWIADKQGKPCFFFKRGFDDATGHGVYKLTDGIPDGGWSDFWIASTVNNSNEIDYKTNVLTSRYEEEHRHDPLLVEAVETLGNEANGACAKLKIVDIPDGVDYIIGEHDGIEWVAERHRNWN